MSKRPVTNAGVFTLGFRKRHYQGKSAAERGRANKAKNGRRRLVQRLRRDYPKNTLALALAKKMAKCRPGRRCHSGACPVCSQAAQEQFREVALELTDKAIRGPAKPQPVAFTIVPATSILTLGKPKDFALMHRRLGDRLDRAQFPLGIGVLEVTRVEHKTGRYQPGWIWHMHGIAVASDLPSLERRLRKWFPKSDLVPRPVQAVPWDRSPAWLHYCHKLDRKCRIGVDDRLRFDVRTKEFRFGRGTERRALTPDEFLELLLFHDSISLDARILTKRCQLRGTRHGCRVVKLRRSKN